MNSKIFSLIILLLCFSKSINAQIINCDWKQDEVIENQVQKFSNGNIWIKNILINDTLWRQEFTTCGELLINAQITQLTRADSLIVFNEEVYEEQLYLTYLMKDILNGKFTQYYNNGIIREEGYYLNGNKSGEWRKYYNSGELQVILNYNKKGKMKGDYKEYYVNGKIKVDGQYDIKRIIERKIKFDTDTYEETEEQEIFECEIKKGKWQYFSKYGILQKESTYLIKN